MNLYEALAGYSQAGAYPFHMPGHKRRAAFLCNPALIDITEIDGFDNLHHAEGLLLEAQNRAASLYGSSETHFLVNGSTSGILSAIGACTRPGDCLLMARNSHRSAYHAAALSQVRTAYLYPRRFSRRSDHESPVGPDYVHDLNGPIDPGDVEEALSCLDHVSAVFVTSPTYDGVISDVESIARIAHRHGVPLIVDEAHGAHFGMHKIFPESSVRLGADLVIHSLHKTLPSLTQTALIHVNSPLVERERLRFLLSVYQTSSPSYVLMVSIDQCIRLLSENGHDLFDAYAGRLQRFYEETRLSRLLFLKTDDPSRILICPEEADAAAGAFRLGNSAMRLYRTLRERFHIQPEMAARSYVLLLSSVCDDDEGFTRLSRALRILDEEAAEPPCSGAERRYIPTGMSPAENILPKAARTDVCCTIADALNSRTEAIPLSHAEGRISAEFLMLYPPGVPLLAPGERITADLIRYSQDMRAAGYDVLGPADPEFTLIRTLVQE